MRFLLTISIIWSNCRQSLSVAPESASPVILQVSGSARSYIGTSFLPHMAAAAVELAQETGLAVPIALHLDHGSSFELAKDCIDSGFSSVMIDASHHSFAENVALTRQVVEYAHAHEVTVEAELGVLGRDRGRGQRREFLLYPTGGGRAVSCGDRGRQPGHLHRHLARGL